MNYHDAGGDGRFSFTEWQAIWESLQRFYPEIGALDDSNQRVVWTWVKVRGPELKFSVERNWGKSAAYRC